jgi:hypothetical protein
MPSASPFALTDVCHFREAQLRPHGGLFYLASVVASPFLTTKAPPFRIFVNTHSVGTDAERIACPISAINQKRLSPPLLPYLVGSLGDFWSEYPPPKVLWTTIYDGPRRAHLAEHHAPETPSLPCPAPHPPSPQRAHHNIFKRATTRCRGPYRNRASKSSPIRELWLTRAAPSTACPISQSTTHTSGDFQPNCLTDTVSMSLRIL